MKRIRWRRTANLFELVVGPLLLWRWRDAPIWRWTWTWDWYRGQSW